MAQQLEPFVKSFSAGMSAGEISTAAQDAAGHQHLQVLLDHLARLQMQEPSQPQTPAPTKDCRYSRNSAPSADNALYMKGDESKLKICIHSVFLTCTHTKENHQLENTDLAEA